MTPLSPPAPPPVPADPVALELLRESLRTNGSGRIHLRGESMSPTLRDGWKVHVRSLPPESLRIGDVAVFVNRGVVTVHRLIWKKLRDGRAQFIFQGDNSAVREAVEADAILGRVETAEGEWTEKGSPNRIPVGSDERAFFYRSAYGIHSFLARWIAPSRLPPDGGRGGVLYRCLRAGFLFLERLFSPRPRRPA